MLACACMHACARACMAALLSCAVSWHAHVPQRQTDIPRLTAWQTPPMLPLFPSTLPRLLLLLQAAPSATTGSDTPAAPLGICASTPTQVGKCIQTPLALHLWLGLFECAGCGFVLCWRFVLLSFGCALAVWQCCGRKPRCMLRHWVWLRQCIESRQPCQHALTRLRQPWCVCVLLGGERV